MDDDNIAINPKYLGGGSDDDQPFVADDLADPEDKNSGKARKSKKRPPPQPVDEIAAKKQAKKRAKKEEEKQQKQERKDKVLNNPIQYQKARQQKDLFWKCFLDTKAGKDMSDVERTDYNLADTSFVKPPSMRIDWRLEELPTVLEEFDATLKAAPAKDSAKGAPRILILASSAYRAIDIHKVLGVFRARFKIGQFFAKHKKPEEQAFFLKSHVAPICVGTPNRVAKLAEMGALSLAECKLIVLDMHRDVKLCTLLDQSATGEDFYKLYKAFLAPNVRAGSLKFFML